MSPITVYTKPSCVQCTATFRALDKAGISYEKIDVTQNADAREYVMSLGYLFSLGFVTVSMCRLSGCRRCAARRSIAAATRRVDPGPADCRWGVVQFDT